jgi:hypothetical protein
MNINDLKNFLAKCNAIQLGYFGEFVFITKMTELGHCVKRVNAGGGDFFFNGSLIDVKTCRRGPFRPPYTDKTDGVTNIAIRVNKDGAEIKFADNIVTVDPVALDQLYNAYITKTGTKPHCVDTTLNAARKKFVANLRRRLPDTKIVRRPWDATQRSMCGKGWGPHAFYIKPSQQYSNAMLVFFRDGTVKIEFILTYRRKDIDNIKWTRKSPGGQHVTFDINQLDPRFRFDDVEKAIAYISE